MLWSPWRVWDFETILQTLTGAGRGFATRGPMRGLGAVRLEPELCRRMIIPNNALSEGGDTYPELLC